MGNVAKKPWDSKTAAPLRSTRLLVYVTCGSLLLLLSVTAHM